MRNLSLRSGIRVVVVVAIVALAVGLGAPEAADAAFLWDA
jgi:hypothetical protein